MITTAAAIQVRQSRTRLAAGDAFAVYAALRDRFGPSRVVLLESLSGPCADRQTAMIGLLPMLSVEVRHDSVRIEGSLDRCRQAALAAGAVVDSGPGLRLSHWNSLWALLRAVRDSFVMPGDATAETFGLGYFGYLGYDVAWSLERLPRLIESGQDVPRACLTVHQITITFDLMDGVATLIVNSGDGMPSVDAGQLAEIESIVRSPPRPVPGIHSAPAPRRVSDSISRDDFIKAVHRAKEYISLGDIYQVQLGHELTIDSDIDPFGVYLRLRHRNPSPYMYLAQLRGLDVIGASPELFIRLEGDQVTLRPIAGTLGRPSDPALDEAHAMRLRRDPKEQAEHLMLVDLGRNDLSRICVPGTLRVDEFMVPERYSHLIHLISNVTAVVRAGHDSIDVLAAAFPAGTMTGAPKVRAMEIIEELETVRREVYAGAIGLIGFSGYVNTALAIRTAVRSGGRYSVRASAGIVADSVPQNEWWETISKVNPAYWAITGQELSAEYAGC